MTDQYYLKSTQVIVKKGEVDLTGLFDIWFDKLREEGGDHIIIVYFPRPNIYRFLSQNEYCEMQSRCQEKSKQVRQPHLTRMLLARCTRISKISNKIYSDEDDFFESMENGDVYIDLDELSIQDHLHRKVRWISGTRHVINVDKNPALSCH